MTLNILMIGPSVTANGGIASVVNEYRKAGLGKKCNISYLPSTTDKNTIAKCLYFFRSYFRACKMIDSCDLVHIHVSKSGSFFRKSIFFDLAKKKRKPIIIHIHSSQFKSFFQESSRIIQRKIKAVLNTADCVVVLSEYWKQEFSSFIDPSKMIVIENGVVMPQKQEKNYKNVNMIFTALS